MGRSTYYTAYLAFPFFLFSMFSSIVVCFLLFPCFVGVERVLSYVKKQLYFVLLLKTDSSSSSVGSITRRTTCRVSGRLYKTLSQTWSRQYTRSSNPISTEYQSRVDGRLLLYVRAAKLFASLTSFLHVPRRSEFRGTTRMYILQVCPKMVLI